MIKIKNLLLPLNNYKMIIIIIKTHQKITENKNQNFKKKTKVLLNTKKVLFPLIKQNLILIQVQLDLILL